MGMCYLCVKVCAFRYVISICCLYVFFLYLHVFFYVVCMFSVCFVCR